MVVGKYFNPSYQGITNTRHAFLIFNSILGASGTGRTTFVNTLCNSNVLEKNACDNPEEAHNEAGITIKPVSVGKQHVFFFH